MQDQDQKPQNKIISLEMTQIEWPAEIIDPVISPGILNWLSSPNLSLQALEMCARDRISVTRRAKSKKERYWVTGGMQYYMCLLVAGWKQKVRVVESDIKPKDIRRHVLGDIQLSLFCTRPGAVAAAAKAAILVAISERSNNDLCLTAPNELLKKCNQALLKELSGYDSRAYGRAKTVAPAAVLSTIEAALHISEQSVQEPS